MFGIVLTEDEKNFCDIFHSILGYSLTIPILIVIITSFKTKKAGMGIIPALLTAIILTAMGTTILFLDLVNISISEYISAAIWYILTLQSVYFIYVYPKRRANRNDVELENF